MHFIAWNVALVVQYTPLQWKMSWILDLIQIYPDFAYNQCLVKTVKLTADLGKS